MKNPIYEGKKKKSSYMAELAEIDRQSSLVALEAKINKLAEMIEAKNTRLNLVSEDENLSELIDKKRVKEMQREIKEIERAKLKLEKLFEKAGGKKTEMVDEEMDDKINPGNTEEDQAKKDDYDLDAMPAHMKEGEDSTYEEDDTVEEGGNIDSNQEPKAFVKKTPYSAMEEVSRWQKLAGLE